MSTSRLTPLPVPEELPELDLELGAFIEYGEALIDAYQEGIGEQVSPAFEPADYLQVAQVMTWLKSTHFPNLSRFCEWGCGFGVVAGIAEQLRFQSTGIEQDPVLIDQARLLIQRYQLSYELVEGSFYEDAFSARAYDLVYAFPWPGESKKMIDWFTNTAEQGSLLFTYHDFGDLRLQRKT